MQAMNLPQWAPPVELILIAATGIALLVAGRRRALSGWGLAVAGLVLFILGQFMSMGSVWLPLRLHAAGMPLAQVGRIISYWSLFNSVLSLAAFLFLAAGLLKEGGAQ